MNESDKFEGGRQLFLSTDDDDSEREVAEFVNKFVAESVLNPSELEYELDHLDEEQVQGMEEIEAGDCNVGDRQDLELRSESCGKEFVDASNCSRELENKSSSEIDKPKTQSSSDSEYIDETDTEDLLPKANSIIVSSGNSKQKYWFKKMPIPSVKRCLTYSNAGLEKELSLAVNNVSTSAGSVGDVTLGRNSQPPKERSEKEDCNTPPTKSPVELISKRDLNAGLSKLQEDEKEKEEAIKEMQEELEVIEEYLKELLNKKSELESTFLEVLERLSLLLEMDMTMLWR